MDTIILNIAISLITLALSAVSTYVVALIRKKIGVTEMIKIEQELTTKSGLATTAIKFVEQAYTALDGAEKYEKAAEWLSATATAHGLKVTDTEIKGLIESSLREAKELFAEAWKKDEKEETKVVTPSADIEKLKSEVKTA